MKKFLHKNILIAGQAGSEKSNFLHRLITTIIEENNAQEARLILMDTGGAGFSIYNGLRNLLVHVFNDPKKAMNAFSWLRFECIKHFREIDKSKCYSLSEYNKFKTSEAKLPEIIFIIDDFSNLMAYDKKFFESRIEDITALSKIAGIYLIIATSNPSLKDVFTKRIRSCFSTRIAFQLSSGTESKFFLGETGAEKPLGSGSLLAKDSVDFKTKKFTFSPINKEELEETIERIKERQFSLFKSKKEAD